MKCVLTTNWCKYLTFGWLLIVIILHLMPVKGAPSTNWMHTYHIDKLIHVFMFLPLSFGLVKNYPKVNIISIVLMLIVLALLLEVFQGTVFVGRTSDVLDFLADFSGILLGIVIIKMK